MSSKKFSFLKPKKRSAMMHFLFEKEREKENSGKFLVTLMHTN